MFGCSVFCCECLCGFTDNAEDLVAWSYWGAVCDGDNDFSVVIVAVAVVLTARVMHHVGDAM